MTLRAAYVASGEYDSQSLQNTLRPAVMLPTCCQVIRGSERDSSVRVQHSIQGGVEHYIYHQLPTPSSPSSPSFNPICPAHSAHPHTYSAQPVMVASFPVFKSDGDKRVHTAITDALPKHFFSNLRIILNGMRVETRSISKDTQSKKRATARRCACLRDKGFGDLIRWSIAYPPTVWEGGRRMRDNLFSRLLAASAPEPELQSAPFFQVVMRELENMDLAAPGCVEKVVTGQFAHIAYSSKV